MAAAISQKELAGFLDLCAARARVIDREPATSRQCWFLAGLIVKSGEDHSEYVLNFNCVLTKSRASRLIDSYVKN
jgi:hypothetical protein